MDVVILVRSKNYASYFGVSLYIFLIYLLLIPNNTIANRQFNFLGKPGFKLDLDVFIMLYYEIILFAKIFHNCVYGLVAAYFLTVAR